MKRAICNVGPNGKPCEGGSDEGNKVTGVIHFEQPEGGNTKISWKITGLAEGEHGFHVHEKADFSNGCMSAGPHFNPFNKTHGGVDDEERHVGDLGNIVANKDGVSEGNR